MPTRERRAIPGIDGYTITRTGLVYNEHEEEWPEPEKWPKLWILHEGEPARFDIIDALAAAWLDDAARATIRSRQLAPAGAKDAGIQELEEALGVGAYAIARVANVADDEIRPLVVPPPPEGQIHEVRDAEIEGYKTFPQMGGCASRAECVVNCAVAWACPSVSG